MSKVRLNAKAGASPGWPGFFGWLASTHPQLYNRVRVMDPNFVSATETIHNTGSAVLAGDDPANQQGSVSRFIEVATQAASAILPLVQQQKVLKLQLQRASQGLPPLDVGAYVDPNQGVQVGLNTGTQRTLLYLGGGIAGAFLLSRLFGRRSR